jgi:hypothetical protein
VSKKTNKYGLTYFEKDDFTSSLPEMQRWETLDAQLYALFQILGNGVLDGWDIIVSSGLTVVVTPGSGHVSFVAVESTQNVNVNLTDSSTNYVYASLGADSYWTKNVYFSSSVFENVGPNYLLIGIVTTSDTGITDINMDGKVTLGFVNLVNNAVKNHRHIGGLENPDQINLETDVQGYLNQNNIPDLDASVVSSGVFDADRLPLIDHINKMTNQGELTHSQLDSFVNSLSLPDQSTMGKVSIINLLQLILALKHIYPDIDEFLVNELAFIPGISPDDYIDTVNTTATVDIRPQSEGGTHTITGTPSTGFQSYTRIWNSEELFNTGTLVKTTVDGDSVSLDITSNDLIIEEFADISTWTIETQDLSTIPAFLEVDDTDYVIPPNSAKLMVTNENIEVILKIKKNFNASDWSAYNYLKFYIKTDSLDHGDLYFYLSDVYYGTQNSYIKILDKNAPTINVVTLSDGWQQVTIDISGYSRQYINEIGFYVSTQSGWDTSKGFYLNLDNFYLTTGNIYQNNGYARYVFGSDFLYQFWRIRWDSIIPTDSDSTGVSLQVRTRVANTLVGLSTAVWSDYYSISGYTIPVDDMYKYIEIEFYFESSTNFKRSVVLKKFYLDFYATDVESSVEYDTKEDWDSGYRYNINTSNVSGSITLSGQNEIGNILYGADSKIVQLDSSMNELFSITGTMAPKSTYQVLNNLPPSFGIITGVARSNNSNIWICDTDNDRVLEIDHSGNVLRGFFGSYLVENTETDIVETTTTATSVAETTAEVTQNITEVSNVSAYSSIYNSNKGFLYIILSRDISDTELALFKGNYIKVGSSVLNLDSYTTTKAMNGFDHVIKIQISGADKTMFNSIVNDEVPSISIISPYQHQKYSVGTVQCTFNVFNFELGTGIGGNGIRVTLDGGMPQDIYSTSITFTGLADGEHTIVAQLLNADSSLNTNIEAIAQGTFAISNVTSQPYIYVTSPRANQIFSSSPVQVSFVVNNFPVIPNGQHIKYTIDGTTSYDHYESTPILIEDMDYGLHTVTLTLVDQSGNDLGYTYGTTTINFIVGKNSNARVDLYYKVSGVVYNIPVDVCNILFTDIYAPFDVQYMPLDEAFIDSTNISGVESIVIGKLTNNYIVSKLL